MAEVHEIHEVEEVPVEPRRGGFALPFIMFLLGGALIVAVVVVFLQFQGTISWPAGAVSLGPNGTVADAGNVVVAPSASVPAPSVTASPAIGSELPALAIPPSETVLPPAADSTGETPVAPADTTPPENE
jgi:hypothetical protein